MTRLRIQGLALALALCAPGLAIADFQTIDTLHWPSTGFFPAYPAELGRTTEMWVEGGVQHDDNIFRLSKDVNTAARLGRDQRSDRIVRLGGGIRSELPISRQTVLLEADVHDYSYDTFDVLNHTEYGLHGEWRWALGDDFSGTLGYGRQRFMSNPANLQVAVLDMLTTDDLFWTGAYRVGPHLRVRGGLDWLKARHSASVQAATALDNTTSTETLGVDYVSGVNSTIGLEVRHADGNFPNLQEIAPLTLPGFFVDNDFKEDFVGVVAGYSPGERTRITGQLGQTKREYAQFPGRNFSGATGRLAIDWQPGEKSLLSLAVYHEVQTLLELAATHVVVTGLSFGPSWAPTARTVIQLLAVNERQKYGGEPLIPGVVGVERSDTVKTLRLGAGWEIGRHLQLAGSIDSGRRTSNLSFGDYKYTAATLDLRLAF